MALSPRTLASSPFTLGAVTLLILCVLALEAFSLWQSRKAAWDNAVREAENVVRTLAASVNRNLTVADTALQGAAEALTLPGFDELTPDLRDDLLFGRAASVEYLASMGVLGTAGALRYVSGLHSETVSNLRDRDYFQALIPPGRALYLSTPFRSRLRAGEPSIALSRRLPDADGPFGGIVFAALQLDYFKDLFAAVRLSPLTVIAVLHEDGILVYRQPSTDGTGNVGLNLEASPAFRRIIADPSNRFTERAIVDGIYRHYVAARVGGFPLVVAAGIAVDDVLREWNQRAIITAVLTLLLCGTLFALFRVLQRTLVRSFEMEEMLKVAASTDALTGLANRRTFDHMFDIEWQRAARLGTDLGLLLLDADLFKGVNDRYGHLTGDRVIRAMARKIEQTTRRPGDLAARYGGEEFAVLLPVTNEAGSLRVAEAIRAAVADTRVMSDDGTLVSITISIGVATLHGSHSLSKADLIAAADRALYAAKSAGRNRVATAGAIPASL